MAKKIDVGGMLNSITPEGNVAEIKQIYDEEKGKKLPAILEEIDTKIEETKNQVEEEVATETTARNAAVADLNANTGISEYPAFDPAEAYAVGDVVVYEGRLRRFVAEHEAGEWNAEQVEAWSERKEVKKYIRAIYADSLGGNYNVIAGDTLLVNMPIEGDNGDDVVVALQYEDGMFTGDLFLYKNAANVENQIARISNKDAYNLVYSDDISSFVIYAYKTNVLKSGTINITISIGGKVITNIVEDINELRQEVENLELNTNKIKEGNLTQEDINNENRFKIGGIETTLNKVVIMPQNYADFSEIHYNPNNVAVTWAADTLKFTETEGVNSVISFVMPTMEKGKVYKLTAKTSSKITIASRAISSEDSHGKPVNSVVYEAGDVEYTIDTNDSSFNYDIVQVGLSFIIPYNSVIELTGVSIVDATTDNETLINNDVIRNISEENLSDELKDRINKNIEVITLKPINYGTISEEDIAYKNFDFPVSIESQNINVDNSGAVNGVVRIGLNGLKTFTEYSLKFQCKEDLNNIDLRYNDVGNVTGTTVYSIDNDGDGNYTCNFFAGKRPLGLHVQFSYTVKEINITDLVVTKYGEQERDVVNPTYIGGLGVAAFDESFIEKTGNYLSVKPTHYKGGEIAVFSRGLFIGDSLTAGGFNTDQGNDPDNPMEDYKDISAKICPPTKIAQMTGIKCVNWGRGGTAYWGNTDSVTRCWFEGINKADEEWEGFDFAVIALGVNDAEVGWMDETSAMFHNIINKLKEMNNGIKIYVCTIPMMPAFYIDRRVVISQRIREHVEGLADENVILLDLEMYGNVSDMAYNAGHLTALGYARGAEDVINYISWHIANNREQYRFVQLIGTDYTYTD